MDKGTIFGVLAGIGLVLTAIMQGSGLATFYNLPALLIVGGGTLAATAIAFPTKELWLIPQVTRRIFNNPKSETMSAIDFMIECRKRASKDGFISLENMARKAPSAAMAKGLGLIADGADGTTIREILSTERKYIEEHHRVGQKIFNEMGKFAPAFGMIGTLIGLVQMLATLDDPSTIGPKMAVALLTTFYGALLANLLFLPMVTKLDRRIKIETFQLQLAIVGMMAINRNDTIIIMREKLRAFLAEQQSAQEAGRSKKKKKK